MTEVPNLYTEPESQEVDHTLKLHVSPKNLKTSSQDGNDESLLDESYINIPDKSDSDTSGIYFPPDKDKQKRILRYSGDNESSINEDSNSEREQSFEINTMIAKRSPYLLRSSSSFRSSSPEPSTNTEDSSEMSSNDCHRKKRVTLIPNDFPTVDLKGNPLVYTKSFKISEPFSLTQLSTVSEFEEQSNGKRCLTASQNVNEPLNPSTSWNTNVNVAEDQVDPIVLNINFELSKGFCEQEIPLNINIIKKTDKPLGERLSPSFSSHTEELTDNVEPSRNSLPNSGVSEKLEITPIEIENTESQHSDNYPVLETNFNEVEHSSAVDIAEPHSLDATIPLVGNYDVPQVVDDIKNPTPGPSGTENPIANEKTEAEEKKQQNNKKKTARKAPNNKNKSNNLKTNKKTNNKAAQSKKEQDKKQRAVAKKPLETRQKKQKDKHNNERCQCFQDKQKKVAHRKKATTPNINKKDIVKIVKFACRKMYSSNSDSDSSGCCGICKGDVCCSCSSSSSSDCSCCHSYCKHCTSTSSSESSFDSD